jgi:hypothetical protein
MAKPRKTCKRCGTVAIQVSGSFLAHYFVEDVCVICREHHAYGMPEWTADRCKMLAAACRAAGGAVGDRSSHSLPCFADGCPNKARTWWFVCSTKCRDRLVRSML